MGKSRNQEGCCQMNLSEDPFPAVLLTFSENFPFFREFRQVHYAL